jgi:hypothetical protein
MTLTIRDESLNHRRPTAQDLEANQWTLSGVGAGLWAQIFTEQPTLYNEIAIHLVHKYWTKDFCY